MLPARRKEKAGIREDTCLLFSESAGAPDIGVKGESMKILVFSDSHGSAYKMEEAVRAENPDFVFFLGDGEGDLHVLTNAFPQLPVQAVRGNCDLYSSLPAERLCVLGGFRFFLTHGHHYGVKYERDFHSLAEQARANGAQAALFGHTHEAYLEQMDGLLLMNPGSARGYGASCGVLEIREGKLLPRIRRL